MLRTLSVNGDGDETGVPGLYLADTHWEAVATMEDPTAEFTPNSFIYTDAYQTWVRDLFTIESVNAGIFDALHIKCIGTRTYGYHIYKYALKMPGEAVWESAEHSFDTQNPPQDGVDENLTTNPITGKPWSVDDLADLQVGVSLNMLGSFGYVIIYHLYIELENYALVSYPSDSMARVSSIRHIYRPGFYRMQLGLGDIGLDIDVAEATVREALDTAEDTEEAARKAAPSPEEQDRRLREANRALKERIAADIRESDRRLWEANERLIREQAEIPYRPPPPEPSLWSKITPWKEEAGETFGGEVMERIRSYTRFMRDIISPGRRQPNTCPICGKSFATITELQAHMRQMHGGM